MSAPSWQARLLDAYLRVAVRRRDWGDEASLTRRARRVFGAPRVVQGLMTRGLRVERVADGDVRGEWLATASACRDDAPRGVLLYVHGGGYVSCSASTHRPITAALARALDRRVLAVDYRLAPEARFPAALDDVGGAWRWLLERGAPGAPVAIAGESAGGGLVLALAQRVRDAGWPPPVCVAALSPWTDLSGSGASVRGNDGRCAMFRPANMAAFASVYLGGARADDPRASPLFGDMRGLPPVLLHVGTTELLLDDARRVHERIVAAGGTSRLELHDHVAHGWHLLSPWMPEARHALADVAAFVREHLVRAGG